MDDFPPQTIAFFIIIRSVQITQFLNKNHHCDRLSCFLCDRSLLSELKCRICKRCTCKSSQSRDNLSCLTLHLTLFKHKLIRNLKLFASLLRQTDTFKTSCRRLFNVRVRSHVWVVSLYAFLWDTAACYIIESHVWEPLTLPLCFKSKHIKKRKNKNINSETYNADESLWRVQPRTMSVCHKVYERSLNI